MHTRRRGEHLLEMVDDSPVLELEGVPELALLLAGAANALVASRMEVTMMRAWSISYMRWLR